MSLFVNFPLRYTAASLAVFTAASISLTNVKVAEATTLPAPANGSFSTVFDFLPYGRIAAFNGFEVSIQEQLDSNNFVSIGTLPNEFLGGSDPAFILTDPEGSFFVLSTGLGGSQFPNPFFNGNILTLPVSGGTGVAELKGNIPYNASADFRNSEELFVNSSTATFDMSSIQRLSLSTGDIQNVINNIPGSSGGIGFDAAGNLFTGIGFDPSGSRTGEIRRFSAASIEQSLLTDTPLDFETDGVFVTQVLSGGVGRLIFDQEGDLFVGGGNLFGDGEQGFIAEINPITGEILRRIDPTDGDPNSGPSVFFGLLSDNPVAPTIGAVDFFDPTRTVFEISTSVPEPGTIIGTVVALSLGFLLRNPSW